MFTFCTRNHIAKRTARRRWLVLPSDMKRGENGSIDYGLPQSLLRRPIRACVPRVSRTIVWCIPCNPQIKYLHRNLTSLRASPPENRSHHSPNDKSAKPCQEPPDSLPTVRVASCQSDVRGVRPWESERVKDGLTPGQRSVLHG